jgi:hypothetical protein
MSDVIASEVFDDGYGYQVKYDEDMEYDRSFKIYATSGTGRYLPVDVVVDPSDENDVENKIFGNPNILYRLPLYLFVHSGISVSTEPFNDLWDSAQCGYAVITKDDFAEGLSDEYYDTALRSYIKEYDAVLRGSVIMWNTFQDVKCDHCGTNSREYLDGCGGYIVTNFKFIDELIKDEIIPAIEIARKNKREAEHGNSDTKLGDD